MYFFGANRAILNLQRCIHMRKRYISNFVVLIYFVDFIIDIQKLY